MPGDGFTFRSRIRNLLRSPSARKKKSSGENLDGKVTLEKVLGVTAVGNSGLACDPRSGLVAYPAGCVVVLLNPKKNKQSHIINTSRKTITALSFSPDGKYLVTGECGHLPAVRVWDVAERCQVAQLQKHKYGVSCVAFSPSNKYIVSVGNQHDMMVNVWAWKKDVVVAANKVSSKVTGVSFSEDSSYFVTVGNRHIRFWYLDQSKTSKASAPVPLLGRSGLLGELRNNFFCDVACGRGSKSDSTFCITSSGLLCEFSSKRTLDKWVDLRTTMAQTLTLSEDLIFCGCAGGTVRAFRTADLHFVCTLPRPHPLGSDISAATEASHLLNTRADACFADVIALQYDSVGRWLSCVYNDHSLYVWDVREVHRVKKVTSALFHAACVWDLELFPDVPEESAAGLSSGSFLTCSADNTIRMWHMEDPTQRRVQSQNILSHDLLNIIYVDGNTSILLDPDCSTNVNADKSGEAQATEIKTGIRTACVSPDGKHLASGDRSGMLRVHELSTMKEILKVEAHDAEILCLEYSKAETGLKLLATASRDRLIHVLNADEDYSLVQTLDEHSSSITAVHFAAHENKLKIISCGADKSIYFRTAHKTDRGTEFRRSHHMVMKTTLYDMAVDATCRYAAVGCQDRCIRVFNISNGKQKKLYKGSLSEDGSLLRVQIDPSGQFVATSCSNKNICIFDFYTGECVATMFGHSEIVTGMKFTNDCRHLISTSGDSCVFVWRLAPELTIAMRERLQQLRQNPNSVPRESPGIRREAYSAPALVDLCSDSDQEHEEEEDRVKYVLADNISNTSSGSSHRGEDTGSEEEKTTELRKHEAITQVGPDATKRPRRCWSRRMGSLEVMIRSMLDLRQLETFGHKRNLSPSTDDKQSVSSLQETVQVDERTRRHRLWVSSSAKCVKETDTAENEDTSLTESGYTVLEQNCGPAGRRIRTDSQDSRSPDSACSMDYDSTESSQDRVLHDAGSLVGSDDESEEEEQEPERKPAEVTSIDEALRTVNDGPEREQEDFLRQNFETLVESSSTAEQSRVLRLSMSSRFLAKGHNNRAGPPFSKVTAKEQDGRSTNPPVSKVRPLTGNSESRKAEDRLSVSPVKSERTPEKDSPFKHRPVKKKSSGSALWRMSNPPTQAPPMLDQAACLQKSRSAQNLTTDSSRSSAPSSVQKELCVRPQQLTLTNITPRSTFTLSLPSSGSPHSPWESPKLKPQLSYMNPTASSMAKTNRSSSSSSSSLGDDLQSGSPPRSPRSRRSSEEALSSTLARLPSSSSSSAAPPRTVTASPSHPTQNGPPSRIPLPRHPLGARRSLNLDVRPSPSPLKASASAVDVGRVVSPPDVKAEARCRHLYLPFDPAGPGSLSVKQKQNSGSESAKEGGQLLKERPLVPEENQTLTPHSDFSVTLETCRQAITDLHKSLRRTILLFTTLLKSEPAACEDQQEMRNVLFEALVLVKTELHSLPLCSSRREGSQDLKLGGDKTLALLEQYAELLLKSVEKRRDTES
ncbi:mitogen-activated protein kinase-binding protein 1 [Austrofundulus limnaeus]|uniref:Mitogen-activated protein kinase-binding protein 1 n=1 Tax=Austrofundulus limnaeus TaxID=52670 RepID=A0A2I4D0J1_AUSLI|nr:PREDICTED: mitogen-activated protein kinase-binding protein 1-like [Austrofundulus limnaeus]